MICLIASTIPPSSSIFRNSAYAASSMRSVSASTKYDPPSGSIVLVTPVSWAITCCVRSATCTASSLGSASASS